MKSEFGICCLSVIPVRLEPSDQSEMISQLLFGDHFLIEEENGTWIKIKTWFDEYEGWIDRKQCFILLEDEYQNLCVFPNYISTAYLNEVKDPENKKLFIPLGCSLPEFNGNQVILASREYNYLGEAKFASDFTQQNLENFSGLYLNSPYLWGGKSPAGIDCSGFTQIIFKLMGIKLPRDAYQQAEKGALVHFAEEIVPGDLLFFDNEEGRITHVGIALNNQNIIHASGKVRIDQFDHVGIFNKEYKKYSHKLRIVKRMGIIG